MHFFCVHQQMYSGTQQAGEVCRGVEFLRKYVQHKQVRSDAFSVKGLLEAVLSVIHMRHET